MSREIKFRAYIKPLKWLVPVERICFDVETVEVDLSDGQGDTAEYDFNEVELMQFTVLKDKNGKEIWEGDLVFLKDVEASMSYYTQCKVNRADHVTQVMFKRGSFGLEVLESHTNYEKGFWPFAMLEDFKEEYEVVGNIWENPELLEVK